MNSFGEPDSHCEPSYTKPVHDDHVWRAGDWGEDYAVPRWKTFLFLDGPRHAILWRNWPSAYDQDPPVRHENPRAELKRITPSNAELLKLAAKSPPPADWLEGDEEELF
jgi:hypothetical protein